MAKMYQYRLGSFHVPGTVECNPDEPHYQGLLVTYEFVFPGHKENTALPLIPPQCPLVNPSS